MRGTDAADVCTTASTLGSNDVLKNNLNRELKKLGLEDSTGAEGGGTCEAGQYAVVDGTIIEGTVVEGTVVDGTFINGTSLLTSCSDCPFNSSAQPGSSSLAASTCGIGSTLIIPEATASVICSGGCKCLHSTANFSGSISEGWSDYLDNCAWLIATRSSLVNSVISISFTSCSTDSCCNLVFLYSCTSSSCNDVLQSLHDSKTPCLPPFCLAKLSGTGQSLNYKSATGYLLAVRWFKEASLAFWCARTSGRFLFPPGAL